MADIKQILHRKNNTGSYDTLYLKSSMNNVTGTLSISNGGTGATTAAQALANLGGISGNHTHVATAVIMQDGTTVQEAIDDMGQSAITEGKAVIATAITEKGVPTASDALFQTMADNIRNIKTSVGKMPAFHYTGSYDALYKEDGSVGVLRLLTSGTITFTESFNADIFLVGGGGGGSAAYANTSTSTPVGGRGGTTTAFNYSAEGGYGATGTKGGNGGSGGGGGASDSSHQAGAGGSNGSDGGDGQYGKGSGDGNKTYAFYDQSYNMIFAGGGGGGGSGHDGSSAKNGGKGGSGGGGNGALCGDVRNASNGLPNTGGGGGGAGYIMPNYGTSAGHGGGGSGYVSFNKNIQIATTPYTITIGAGGAGINDTSGGKAGDGGSGVVLIRVAQ